MFPIICILFVLHHSTKVMGRLSKYLRFFVWLTWIPRVDAELCDQLIITVHVNRTCKQHLHSILGHIQYFVVVLPLYLHVCEWNTGSD
jgi:hypothetical protein